MKKHIKKIILLLITVIFLYFVFVNIDLRELLTIIKEFNLKYIIFLSISIICSLACRGICFKQLISRTVNVPLSLLIPLCLTSASLNILLPARAGDIFRAFFIGQKYNVSKIKIFGTVMLERIFDVFVIFCFLLAGVFIYHKNDIAIKLCIFAGVCIFIGITFAIVTFKYNKTDQFCDLIIKRTKSLPFSKLIEKATIYINKTCNSFFNGFEIIDAPKKILTALIASFGIWFFECLNFFITIQGFGYNLHWSVTLFIICFIALACMIPSTSIFIGPYQLAIITAFAIYNINKEAALAISFVEQTIVPYAQADDYIQVGSGFIEQACLEDGVAHGCTDTFAPGRNAHRGLGLTGYLANHRVWLKAVGAQDAGEDTRFVDKSDAVGYTDTSGVDFSGKFHDFLHACPLAIALVLHFSTGNHNFAVVAFVVAL